MPRQRSLLPKQNFTLEPEPGRTEPKFWIQRLLIWEEPDRLIRETKFRPGLNIIWSPDPSESHADQAIEALGHGSGKTLLCRLIRFLLGEEYPASHNLTRNLALKLPEGLVGAEVRVDGSSWSLIRSLGIGRNHSAARAESLESHLRRHDELSPESLNEFFSEMNHLLGPQEVIKEILSEVGSTAWLMILAWLTRDQECRFDHVLDWRTSESDSGSPVRKLSRTNHTDIVRAGLGVIQPKELLLREEQSQVKKQLEQEETSASDREKAANRLRSRLLKELSIELVPQDHKSAIETLERASRNQLVKSGIVEDSDTEGNKSLNDLRGRLERRRESLRQARTEKEIAEARVPNIHQQIGHLEGQGAAFLAKLDEAENPLCPVCEVPIDRVLAGKCDLSHVLPDTDRLRREEEVRKQTLVNQKKLLSEQEDLIERTARRIREIEPEEKALHRELKDREKLLSSEENPWISYQRQQRDIDELKDLLSKSESRLSEEQTARLEAIELEMESCRNFGAATWKKLSNRFDAIVQELIPEASGNVVLDGQGLKPSIHFGGDRATAAMESLKVVVFDLAAMTLSIEGQVDLPSFFIHDSPREADLGESIYHALFRFVRSLEPNDGAAPLFQYIITTTTAPPLETRKEPYLIQKLYGSPAEERLLRRDL